MGIGRGVTPKNREEGSTPHTQPQAADEFCNNPTNKYHDPASNMLRGACARARVCPIRGPSPLRSPIVNPQGAPQLTLKPIAPPAAFRQPSASIRGSGWLTVAERRWVARLALWLIVGPPSGGYSLLSPVLGKKRTSGTPLPDVHQVPPLPNGVISTHL